MKSRELTAALTVLALLAPLTGCSSTIKDPETETCLVPGEPIAVAPALRANAPAADLPDQVWDALYKAAEKRKSISIFRVDGSPNRLYNETFEPESKSDQGIKQELDIFKEGLDAFLTGEKLQATTNEVDVLKALTLAGQEVGPGGNVVLVDSGLQTVPPLDFRDGGLLTTPNDSIIDYLKKNNLLPDLKGRHVYLGGLGAAAAPQKTLDNSLDRQVTDLWKRIADESGAQCAYPDPSNPTAAAPKVTATVSLVKLPPPPPPPTPPTPCKVIEFTDKEIGFKVDSAEFRDPGAARNALKKTAEVIVKDNQSALVTGATSSEGSDAHNKDLSKRRAEAVRTVLVKDHGVPPTGRIKTEGKGEHLKGREDDTGPGGVLIIDKAVLNRKVVVKLSGPACPK